MADQLAIEYLGSSGIRKPDYEDPRWDIPVNVNWETLAATMYSLLTWNTWVDGLEYVHGGLLGFDVTSGTIHRGDVYSNAEGQIGLVAIDDTTSFVYTDENNIVQIGETLAIDNIVPLYSILSSGGVIQQVGDIRTVNKDSIVGAIETRLAFVDVVDLFLYRTRKDSDGGVWRKRIIGGTPQDILILARVDEVIFIDITDPALPTWMVTDFTGYVITSVSMLNAVLFVATTTGLYRYNFISEEEKWYTTTSEPPITNDICNYVAMTVRPDSPISPSTGIQVPIKSVFTNGGISVVDGPAGVGTSVSSLNAVKFHSGGFNKDGVLYGVQDNYNLFVYEDYDTDLFERVFNYSQTSVPAINPAGGEGAFSVGKLISWGSDSGMTLIKENILAQEEGSANYIETDYQSGWMFGDIKVATLADTVEGLIFDGEEIADRSTNNNPLQVVGEIDRVAVAANAELVAYIEETPGSTITGNNAIYADTQYLMGWEEETEGFIFKSGIASSVPLDTVDISGTVITISPTKKVTLIKLSEGTPSADVLMFIEGWEKHLFNEGSKCSIQGASNNILSLSWNEEYGSFDVLTADGVTVFSNGVASDLKPYTGGVVVDSSCGKRAVGGATADYSQEQTNLLECNCPTDNTVERDFTFALGATTYELEIGWIPYCVHEGGLLVSSNDYTVITNGFTYSVVFGAITTGEVIISAKGV